MDQDKEMSTNDLAELMTGFAGRLEADMKDLKEGQIRLETRMTAVETKLTRVEATMVTKSYLDDKLADTYGDAVAMVKKEDVKVDSLVGSLEAGGSLKKQEADKIKRMSPFPKLRTEN